METPMCGITILPPMIGCQWWWLWLAGGIQTMVGIWHFSITQRFDFVRSERMGSMQKSWCWIWLVSNM